MVSFLNLTDTPDAYKAAYCLNPPSDDTCSFGYCDNPDIAGEPFDQRTRVFYSEQLLGLLVRVACEFAEYSLP